MTEHYVEQAVSRRYRELAREERPCLEPPVVAAVPFLAGRAEMDHELGSAVGHDALRLRRFRGFEDPRAADPGCKLRGGRPFAIGHARW